VATALDHQSISLTWHDMSADEMGFNILRKDAGTIATTLADVTEYTDTGLADDTVYEYLIYAFNSAGDAWPSNGDTATTEKLPLIFAISPPENHYGTSIDIFSIKVGFGDSVDPADVTVVVSDEVGPIDGGWSLDGAATTLTFIPDPLLLTMNTRYTVEVAVGAATYEYVFNTQGANWTVNIEDAVGRAFAMSIFDAEIVEPSTVEAILGGLGIEMYLILGVLQADSANNQMTIIGALGDPYAADPKAQDKSQPTLLFPVPANTDSNPEWVLGPMDLPLIVQDFELTIIDVTLSGIFERDYNYSGKGEFRGGLDLGVLAPLAGLEPWQLCTTLGGCNECPGDPPGRYECIQLYLRNMRADLNALPVEPVAQVVPKDLGGNTVEHTVELTLTHPANGAPQESVQLRVTRTSGDGWVDGGAETIVTTNADGKAFVLVTDLNGGQDNLDINIESAVLYEWVSSKIEVNF
jgi:hypothetical protein